MANQSQEPRVVIARPWVSPGIGWILAVIAVVITVGVLLQLIPPSEKLVWVDLLLIALAILL